MKKYVPLSSIIIRPERQRRFFDPAAMEELKDSIQAHTLLHAPVLQFVDSTPFLVAGERRLRAMADLHTLDLPFVFDGEQVPHGFIPYVELKDLDPLEAEEAELDENIRRADLTWQERADAHARLFSLREKQAAKAGEPAPLPFNLAKEIYSLEEGEKPGGRGAEIRKDIILAKHLDDPDIASAATKKQAFKILQQKEHARRHEELASSHGALYSSSAHTLINADSQEWCKGQAGGQFTVILTDPPYGINADTFGSDSAGMETGSNTRAHSYDDSAENLLSILEWFPAETFRLATEQAHAYIFCDIDWFPQWKTSMIKAGWKVFRTPLIWHKPDGFRAPWPEQGPQRKYETILYAVKGEKKVTRIYPDVITCNQETASGGHPAAKPPALAANLLSRSTLPGDKVLDLFCGGGMIFEAAHSLKLYATGIEKDPQWYGRSLSRIKDLK